MEINIEVNDEEAMALAQFVKRIGRSEIRVNSVNEEECYIIRDTIYKIQRALEEEGYSPR